MLALTLSASAQLLPPRLEALPSNASNGWVHLSSSFHSNTVLTLEASTNLATWQSIGTLHDALFSYPDASAGGLGQRFYRLRATPRGTEDDWKNQILYPTDSLRSTNGSQDIRWVKFAIVLSDPTRVYYQDSKKYPFHYDFATRRLAPFQGLDYAGFDAISLSRTNQQVVLGSVLYPPGSDYPPTTLFAEYGVQFVGMDPYTPEEIGRWFELVKATVYASNGATAYYLPAFEQSEMARTNAEAFAALGIPLASPDRWITVPACYATGWALGRLKYFPAAEISAAFGDGRLRPEDILLTDGVPADTPLVAGIISLTPSTPNSHTAILSQSFGIPFVYLANAAERQRVQQLVGHKVLLRAMTTYLTSQIKIVDLEGVLDPGFEAEVLALKRPEPIAFLPRQSYGALWASTETLVPMDIQYFGGKAANYGVLRRTVPTNCPVALAFSFDLWDAFLDQVLPGGQTLRAEIATRLAPFTNYPPDMVALKTNLGAIRDLFTKTASFTPLQQQAITNALASFNPRRNIRFRSSTNVEDSEHFTGAGLYDSYSGCLLDDLDGDTLGPCQCDPSEPKERGVFRALQKVYASFYNDDAYLERLRHGVDESQVGM
ncbi:MAG TPA: PEP/pyruvate-binding domain-containing protein, partial [Candidatus Sulfotelmatobacter sp.]|nr:PEP/pyruvate-binding domain-containing protein [Candidatus Sulfotelmatobacter sp.]